MTKHKFANNNTLSPQKRLNQLKYDVKKKYGLTLEEAREIRNNPCEICKCIAKKMVIDHVIDGTHRGVLCQQCNTRLGWLESKKDIILSYIKRDKKEDAKAKIKKRNAKDKNNN